MKSDSAFAYPYAKAIFEFAVAKKQIADWEKVLLALVDLLQVQKVAALCRDQRLAPRQRAEVFLEICSRSLPIFTEGASKFIYLLFQKNRLALLPHIVTIYKRMQDDYDRKLRVRVATAQILAPAVQQKMLELLSQRYKRTIDLQCEIDERLLGGVVIYINDKVIDNSILSKFQLIQKAA